MQGRALDTGALRAIGSDDELIEMRGAVETAGFWESIVFSSNNPANEIAFAEIAHGGKGDDFSFSGNTATLILVTGDAQATVRDSWLTTSGGACFAGDGDLTQTDNVLSDCI